MMIFMGTICVIVLLGLSAFFSGSETALVSLSRYRLKRLIIKNKAFSNVFMSWLTAPQYILTTVLVGNTMVNIGATSLMTILAFGVFAGLPHRWVEVGVWFFMMLVILIWGEITPKIYSRRHAEKVSLFAIRPLYYLTQAIKPFIRFTLWVMHTVAPGLYVAPVSRYSQVTVDELRLMITESGVGGGLGILTGEMMKKVLSFEQLVAEKIMTPLKHVERVKFPGNPDDDTEWDGFYSRIIEIGHTRIPIYYADSSTIDGYIHINDLVDIPEKSTAQDRSRLVRSGISVNGKKKVSELLREFKTGRTHLAFVKDSTGKVHGIVTLEDVLEAIVGEIVDEFDLEKVRKQP